MINTPEKIAPPASVAALVEQLRAARLKPRTTKPPPSLEIIDVGARLARVKARWNEENEQFWRECAARHADDVEPAASERPERKRRPLMFRERDLRRAIAGHLKAGLSVVRTEIDVHGLIIIVTRDDEPVSVVPVNEWDSVT
jgi:hypothetical protein